MLQHRVASHYGYAVADIGDAVRHWSDLLGAGPFFLVEDMAFDHISYRGADCTFVHSAAFGQWGSVAIELMQISQCSPRSFAESMIPGPMPILNHIAYLSPDLDRDSASLESLGAPAFLHARFGEVEVRVHDAVDKVGCNIEIHRKSDFIESFFAHVKNASIGWDGTTPLRGFAGVD